MFNRLALSASPRSSRTSLLNAVLITTLLSSGFVSSTSHAWHGKSQSSVMGNIRLASGETAGDLSSVNGNVNLGSQVTARDVSTVNGDIDLGDEVRADEVSTVNGSIEAGSNLLTKGDVETVNGRIRLDDNAQIGGDLGTVNGDIEMRNGKVARDLTTTNGDIELTGNSHVQGDIIYEYTRSYGGRPKVPRLTLGKDVTVDGRIILKREVTLEIANPALLDKVEHQYKK